MIRAREEHQNDKLRQLKWRLGLRWSDRFQREHL